MKIFMSIICLLTALALSISLEAQVTDETSHLPITAHTSYSIWSSDSQVFTFVDLTNDNPSPEPEQGLNENSIFGPIFQKPYWEAYFPNTNQYVVDYEWLLQPELTIGEMELINTDDIVRSSPDGSTILYTSPVDENNDLAGWTFRIFRRSVGEEFDTEIQTFGSSTARQSVEVIWGDESLAIFIIDPFGGSNIYYIHNYDSTIPTLYEIDTLDYNNKTYQVLDAFRDRLFDISEDGLTLLVTTLEFPPQWNDVNELAVRIVLWNPISPNESYVFDGIDAENVVTASFAPDNTGNILTVQSDGSINEIEPFSGHVQSITALYEQIYEAGLPTSPRFSPNGEWLAYFQVDPVPMVDILNVLDLIKSRN